MWTLANSLDPRSAQHWLMQVYETTSVDMPSAARCLSTTRLQIGTAVFTDWLDRLPDDPLEALLREAGSSSQRLLYVPKAWGCFDRGEGVADAAMSLLEAEAVAAGTLEAVPDALAAIPHLIDSDNLGKRGAALLPKLRLRPDAPDAHDVCVAMHGDPLISQASAVMLAELPKRPITPADYDSLAAAVADETGPLRRRAIGALGLTRQAEIIEDAVFARSWFHAHERLAVGDAAASWVHEVFGTHVVHCRADRVLTWLREGNHPWIGQLTVEAVNDLLRGAYQLDDATAARAVDACRFSPRSRRPSGADLGLLEHLCAEATGDCQRNAAELLGAEAVLTGATDVFERVATNLVETSPRTAAQMLRAAAWAADTTPSAEVHKVVAHVHSMLVAAIGHTTETVGIGVLIDVQAERDPSVTVRRCTPSTARAVEAIIFALDTDVDWLPATPTSATLYQQIAQLSIPLSRGHRGMNDVISECMATFAR